MDILDMDTLVSFLANADDPLCHDHKHTSQTWILSYCQFFIFSFQQCKYHKSLNSGYPRY